MSGYGAQVIIEKVFASKDAAENWMARVSNSGVAATADNVEAHLWEESK